MSTRAATSSTSARARQPVFHAHPRCERRLVHLILDDPQLLERVTRQQLRPGRHPHRARQATACFGGIALHMRLHLTSHHVRHQHLDSVAAMELLDTAQQPALQITLLRVEHRGVECNRAEPIRGDQFDDAGIHHVFLASRYGLARRIDREYRAQVGLGLHERALLRLLLVDELGGHLLAAPELGHGIKQQLANRRRQVATLVLGVAPQICSAGNAARREASKQTGRQRC
ncbi:hypothetical protein GJG85_21975 [Burkholderia sp. MS389]|uniref:hypothetical protein n=1 Tax=Burkholderia sp. MS389 TaxID=2811789 RepID=UPI00195CCB38|nr:hypothetical protein [Burkholderia sp. MS389]QRR16049.1 hypothetical protein GJG85_21975 [Burkholderia sp. MS389]